MRSGKVADIVDALRDHIATLKTDVERLEAQLAGAAVDLAAERARAHKAIDALAGLAERLDALAAANQRVTGRSVQNGVIAENAPNRTPACGTAL